MAFEGLSAKLNNVFGKLKGHGKLSEKDIKDAMREVRMALLDADVNYKVAKDFVARVSEKAVGAQVMESLTPAQQVIDIVHGELIELMGNTTAKLDFPSKPPCVIMMCGLQGAGKTTHCAKLAKYLKEQNRRPLLVACDVYRPAAIEQLKIMGEKAGARVFEMGQIDPVKIAKEGIKYAKDNGFDVVMLDTAGRLHIDETLMEELENIKRETQPNEILLVVDSMTGQDAVNVAESFNNALDITGVILTKLDGDTRGGAALTVLAITGKPVKFAGIGEKIDAIEP
ncbi:MAG: signal recognition particle protein Srp54, partial [Oscillospiraceae bacterium]|nr:signal recognition particle protein Srp54 [Oscillospiraceae bacterium]